MNERHRPSLQPVNDMISWYLLLAFTLIPLACIPVLAQDLPPPPPPPPLRAKNLPPCAPPKAVNPIPAGLPQSRTKGTAGTVAFERGATALASGPQPDALRVRNTFIYWVGCRHTQLIRMSKSGGPPAVIFSASGQDSLGGIAADETGVYFSTANRIMMISSHDVKPAVLASTADKPESGSQSLVVDEKNVYWVGAVPKGSGITFLLMKVSKEGGSPTVLASDLHTTYGLAIDETSVYWVQEFPFEVWKVSKGGGDASALARLNSLDVGGIAVDGTSVYVGVRGGIQKLDKNNGSGVTLVPENSGVSLYRIAVDETNVYWYTHTNKIMKVNKSGGRPVVVAAAQDPSDVAVDEAGIYWTEFRRGLVMEAKK